MKKKKILDKKKHDEKKSFGRTPTAPATKWHKDKTKYNRKVKHKKDITEKIGFIIGM